MPISIACPKPPARIASAHAAEQSPEHPVVPLRALLGLLRLLPSGEGIVPGREERCLPVGDSLGRGRCQRRITNEAVKREQQGLRLGLLVP